jgi:hypothetical protein
MCPNARSSGGNQSSANSTGKTNRFLFIAFTSYCVSNFRSLLAASPKKQGRDYLRPSQALACLARNAFGTPDLGVLRAMSFQ